MASSYITSNWQNVFDELRVRIVPDIVDYEMQKRSNKLAKIMRSYIPGKGEGRTGVNTGTLKSDIRAYKVADVAGLPSYVVTTAKGSKASEYAVYADQGRGPVVGNPYLGSKRSNSSWAKWQSSLGIQKTFPVRSVGPAEGYNFVEQAIYEFLSE